MQWETVYDFANESFSLGKFFIPVLFAVLGFGIAIITFLYDKPKGRMNTSHFAVGLTVGSLALVACFLGIPAHIGAYNLASEIYETKNYKILEGRIDHFKPMPYEGHRHESFSLNDAKFSYSDYDGTHYGFNQTKSHGGPLDQGKMVRLYYFDSDGGKVILKIEMPKGSQTNGSHEIDAF